ncbi:hypothetical protein BO78DRAFT_450480 [Aspergillus sclerotiicarbonarius CBS 121057]|uniref:Condensation domain-containing protein n=1 Tax=Aspergillus sclerotiicarbonarius (strain CBS 121057 / IBT 28362) TaxID=1448318 RepID=A0A319EK94_ASPSB|nr:hypothetical protein BO78DRAFT_450480 [Aspergillus sclerotiicarbonarius CBS 121057]
MAWSQVSARRWERPADGMESWFALTESASAAVCDGRRQFTIFTKIQVDLNIPSDRLESCLKEAWTQLRYEQPQIATIQEGMTKVYEVPDEAVLQAWIASTFIISAAANGEELHANAAPIDQATLYYLPGSSELVLRAPHDTVDGTGMILLLDRFLRALVSPPEEGKITFGDEPSRLTPCLGEVLGVAEECTPEEVARIMEIFKPYLEHGAGMGHVSNLGSLPAGRCRHARLDVPWRTTEAIVQACKAKRISVTAAVHAAYIQTLMKHADPNRPSCHYITTGQFNLRDYLPKRAAQYAASLYYTMVPLHLESPGSFGDTSQAVNQYYRTTFRDDTTLLPLVPHLTRLWCAGSQTPEMQAAPVPRDAVPSSLGVIERYLQRSYGDGTVTVRDFMMATDALGVTMLVFSSFRDQLQMVYSYNDGHQEREHIQQYLQDILAVLTEELLAD